MPPSFISHWRGACPVDTIQTMEVAAENRLWDGIQLALHPGHETGSIYLLGYVAEILAKTAYYHATGIPTTKDVGNPGAILGPTWPGGNFHAIEVWVRLLIKERSLTANPMDPTVAGLALRHVATIWSHWRETLRYASIQADVEVVEEVYSSVEWLKRHHSRLWG